MPTSQSPGSGTTDHVDSATAEPAGAPPPRSTLRTVAGVTLLVLAAAAIALGFFLINRDSGGNAAEASFDLPQGWVDRTEELAGQAGETEGTAGGEDSGAAAVQPSKVFVGPTTGGYTSRINLVEQPGGEGSPPLAELAEIVSANLREDLGATLTGERRTLSLGGTPAVAYEYRYEVEGRQLHGRQIIAYRDGSALFVNFTAHEQAFDRDARAVEQLVTSWSWS